MTLVKQNFDMVAFLKRKIDAASAMTYNELAQVLETKNPARASSTRMNDLNVIKMAEVGTGMLQDGIFTNGSCIKDAKNQATAMKFLTASLKGWAFCRTMRSRASRPSSSRARRFRRATRRGR